MDDDFDGPQDDDFDWPRWLDEARDELSAIYWATKDVHWSTKDINISTLIPGREPEEKLTMEVVLFRCLHNLSRIEQAYLEKKVSRLHKEIFTDFVEINLSTLQLMQRSLDANKIKGVGPTPMLDEMTKLIKANPDLLKITSNTKLARALSEASSLKLNFSREYVRDYRERVKKALI
jgi:hypothetical protein